MIYALVVVVKNISIVVLNKTDALSKIENEQQRQLALCDYPKMPQEGVEGRVYLTDYYDDESIEIDKLVYLALKERPDWTGQPQNSILKMDRIKKYLSLAFQKFVEKVESEKIHSAEEYNKKYAIIIGVRNGYIFCKNC